MNATLMSSKHYHYLIKKRAIYSTLMKWLGSLGTAIALLSFLSTSAYAEQHAAGTVSMTIGKAYLNGNTLIKVGTELNEGDTIETLSNGHVYIRFVDNGLVSIRPDSKLLIEHYQYNSETPSESVIKFDLSEGVMRSISGAGAKAARDKFRLNTPIAAIGVRGTDFVVKASSSLIQAIVNEGAIIVAPFSDACAADTFGPCSENSVELTGQAKQLLEVSALTSTPRLIPLSDTFAAELKNSLSADADADADADQDSNADSNTSQNSTTPTDSKNDTKPTTSGTNSSSINLTKSASAATMNAADSNNGVDQDLKSTPKDREEVESLVSAYVSDSNLASAENRTIPDNYVPVEALDATSLSERKLTWGRWGNTLKTDRIITSVDLASSGKSIATTVVNKESSDISLLYRQSSDLNELDPTLAGNMSFYLVDAQATLTTSDGVTSLMEVTDGSLDIDFSRGTFGTTLMTNHELLSSELQLSAEGTLNNKGIMQSTSSNGYLKGATTLEGDAASYILHRDIDLGSIDAAAYFDR